MKNVTITVDEEIAQKARVEAAKAGKSMSRWIGDLIRSALGSPDARLVGGDWLDEPLWRARRGLPSEAAGGRGRREKTEHDAIALPENIAQWARGEAAKSGLSLSRWISDRLSAEMGSATSQSAGLDALLSLPLGPLSESGRLPPRSELYDRDVLRRLERAHLRKRPASAEKKRKSR